MFPFEHRCPWLEVMASTSPYFYISSFLFLMAWAFSTSVYTYAIFICLLKRKVRNKTSYINFRGFEEDNCYWSPLFFSAFSFHIWSKGIIRFSLKLAGFAPGCKHCSHLLPPAQVSKVCYKRKKGTSWPRGILLSSSFPLLFHTFFMFFSSSFSVSEVLGL